MDNIPIPSRPCRPSGTEIYSPWDPRSGAYITRCCRAEQHDRCSGGLTYYPEGWEGTKMDIACACEHEGCACAGGAVKDGQPPALAGEALPQPAAAPGPYERWRPRSPEEEPASPAVGGPDPVVDRAIWERLRRAAYRGLLLPEGLQLVDQLHDLYPDWREEW